MSGRHSYGGPSDSHVLMNPMPQPNTSSRSVNGPTGGGKAVASKNKVNGGGVAGRHSLGSTSSVAPTPTSQQPHQQYSSISQNNNYHQRSMHQDMVVENNIPNPIMTNNNTNPPHYAQPPPVHHNPPPNTRKTKTRTANIQEIITIESDPDDNAKNNMNKQPLPASGPSLAGPASRNRSLLNGHYDPVRPNLASASPSISFLTDPQPTPSQLQPQPAAAVPISVFRKPVEKSVAPPIIKPEIDSPPISASIKVAIPNVAPTPPPVSEQPEKPAAKAEKPAKEPTGQRSPKTAKTKKGSTAVSASIPKASGNGLLSGLPGVDIPGDSGDRIEIPTIYIHVPLNGQTNKYVNFAKLAEEKYGAFAINPRAHRERLKLAELTDEMDTDSDSIGEGDRKGDGGESTADNKPTKKRGKRKAHDNYDSHDPFIDDSEDMYVQQAAAAKDGFFVYSGPLIPQGEKVHVERADGTTSKRGRGGGRGSRGGARGGAAPKPPTTRKPRQSKKAKEKEEAERARLEAQKQAS